MSSNETKRLKFPHRRIELLGWLRDLSLLNESCANHEIDEVYHFFFDDNDYRDAPLSEVGQSLHSNDEAAIVFAVTLALDDLLKELGDQRTLAFIQHRNWPLVVELAKLALVTLRPGEPPRGVNDDLERPS